MSQRRLSSVPCQGSWGGSLEVRVPQWLKAQVTVRKDFWVLPPQDVSRLGTHDGKGGSA